jgi:hypothetical protein
MELETAGYHYWVLVTNDHITDAVTLEAEHCHKAQVESGMRELKENFGLAVLRKHGFMANWGVAADRGHRAESDALVAAARIAR